ncbi:MAG TPA: hypothetical protein VMV44_07835 [Rectinemataceae bacterium]|nr:hypothetical protein [Rectinemataceae bacterium]
MKRFIIALWIALLSAALFADSFSFSADSVQSVLAAGKEKTVLMGHAKVLSDKISVSADRIEISGPNYSLLFCEGSVVADDKKNGIHLEAPRLTYDRDRSLAILEGPSVLEDGENHVVLKANWIQDDGDQGVTVAQVDVRILKEGLACRSEYAIYRRKEHRLELNGAPRVVKNGDEYRATRMVIDTDSEQISLEGSVSGSVHTASTQGTTQGGSPSGGAAGTTAGTPAADSPTAASPTATAEAPAGAPTLTDVSPVAGPGSPP